MADAILFVVTAILLFLLVVIRIRDRIIAVCVFVVPGRSASRSPLGAVLVSTGAHRVG
jgi:hypothetical protein